MQFALFPRVVVYTQDSDSVGSAVPKIAFEWETLDSVVELKTEMVLGDTAVRELPISGARRDSV